MAHFKKNIMQHMPSNNPHMFDCCSSSSTKELHVLPNHLTSEFVELNCDAAESHSSN